MAYLSYEGTPDSERTREAWLMFAVEFARRGLWPTEDVETHGPHAPESTIWGKAMVEQASTGETFLIEFGTPGGRDGIWDVRGLRVWVSDGFTNTGDRFPVLPAGKLPQALREKMKAAQAERSALREQAHAERETARRSRERLRAEVAASRGSKQ